ncbi:hypothetical protein ACJDU8_17355 [Clostridium sp. WILCCON 0269]|uniref:Transposase n=1 Tax=Candidatus Clostridium eludens TaxID=3381663 RepID=A0ABW8SNR9_9CLOT
MAVAFERTRETLDFVRDNWEIMPRKDMAKKLGCSPSLVGMIGTELGLPIQHKLPTLPKDSFYRTESIRRMKNNFRLGQEITLKVGRSRGKYKFIKGVVADKTDYLVLVRWKRKGNHRRESFKYAEFCVGEVQVV